ncbi:MAG TPA: lamin tail domain-containing protein [Candidatus Saccharimonadales bacterium]|nr:lamin tail domain-containing protein [Candidatus Saccharimonadales bacterium]
MKRFYLFALIITVICSHASPVAAEEDLSSHVVIAAVQTGKTEATGEDYVEIYNPTTAALDVTGWKLQYRAANAKGANGWATKRTVACLEPVAVNPCIVTIKPHDRLLFATYDIAGIAEQPLATGFNDAGGQLRLVDNAGTVQDMLGYGTALEAEQAQPAPAPPLGLALLRKSNEGHIVDTDNNAGDFLVGCYMPMPPGEVLPAGPPVTQPCPVIPNEDDEQQEASGVSPATTETPPSDPQKPYPQLFITELLPDPASPQTDSDDEFIELYNPFGDPVDATGYMLEGGSDFRYHFTLSGVIVPAGGYVAIPSSESHISLANSGTLVRLVNPAGEIVDTVANYGSAKSGQSWAKVDGVWQWTTSPTPGGANVIVVPAVPVAAKKAAAKPAVSKTSKIAKASTGATKAAKTTAAAASIGANKNQGDGNGFSYWLLAPIGALAVGYIGYEYRHDIVRLWHKAKQAVSGKKGSEPTPQTD